MWYLDDHPIGEKVEVKEWQDTARRRSSTHYSPGRDGTLAGGMGGLPSFWCSMLPSQGKDVIAKTGNMHLKHAFAKHMTGCAAPGTTCR